MDRGAVSGIRVAIACALGAVLAPGCARRAPEGQRMEETVIYAAARVRTLDPARPLARAVAVRGGRSLAVGELAEVRREAGEDAQLVDLGSATIVPGLVDAHAHTL